jgi:ABC-type glycerol-3-phosphate transport system substrate-binding protein
MSGVQPVMLFYDKEVFRRARLTPPRTYDELLTLVDAFAARGIQPLALSGADGWPALMYLMYLVDRIGGPRVFADIAAGRPGAWSDPAVLRAARLCRQLVERGAFGADFGSLAYADGEATNRLATGRAAMQLMGSWEYAAQLTVDPSVARGSLGWVPFPTVSDGVGDPADVVGVPANFFSVSSDSAHPDRMVDFLLDTLVSQRYVDGLLAGGEIPAVVGAQARAAATPDAAFLGFTHRLVAAAPSFTLAWDQALTPSGGATLNANVRRLFALRLSPEQFVAAMAGTR